jgi:ribonucleoside-diphosphate reductase alpha chain
LAIVLSQNALTVLQKRYLKKDEYGHIIETPEDMFKRVASTISKAERIYDPRADVKRVETEFLETMSNLEFLPNSPTLMNAGRKLNQLSACFVIPVEDSLNSIFEAVKHTALIHQSGGGTGFSFSNLRPSDDMVGSTGGIASGPVSFMKVFNVATEVIKQGGTRRGANMGVLRVDHPDIVIFITAKTPLGELTNFNISAALTDAFMDALGSDGEYPLINPRTKKIVGYKRAGEVFNLIVESAWRSGEPGILFIDRINRANPTPQLGKISATNPCGEQPLLPYESCNLGSINLMKVLRKKEGRWEIDYKKLGSLVRLGVRFLDNVIDMNKYPLPEIETITKGNRKIGLGIMGFADMLVRLRVPYYSDKALEIGEGIMEFINSAAWETSMELAKERGAFPNLKGSVFDEESRRPVRNSTTTTIAPTGTLSIIAGCSSGIEPLYSLSYTRQVLNGTQLPELDPIFQEVAREEGFYSDELMDYVASGGKLSERRDVPDYISKIFTTAFQILPEDHIKIQAAFQKHTDNAVSKTINFSNKATSEDVRKAYLLAYKLGCKGVAVYRSGTREQQVLTCNNTLYC